MTLTEFLAARLDEDDALVKAVALITGVSADDPEVDRFLQRLMDTGRLYREAEAKRAILAMETNTDSSSQWSGWADAHGTALEYLAAVYSDHPDYDKTWSPR